MRSASFSDRSRCRLPRRVSGPAAALLLLAAVGCGDLFGPSQPVFPQATQEERAALPDSVRAAYQDDAARMAVRHVRQTDGPAAREVRLSSARPLADTLFDALVALHTADHAVRDSIVELYGIHTDGLPGVRRLLVTVDSTPDWVRAWAEGRRLTGHATVDSLLTRFDLSVESYRRYSALSADHGIVLGSAEPLNMPALAERFRDIDHVRTAGPSDRVALGGSIDIRTAPALLARTLEFSVGYGDCPSGCINHHVWSFYLDRAGRLHYLGGSGDPAPEPPGSG